MKFNVDTLKKQVGETIQEVFNNRGRKHQEAKDRLKGIELLTPEEAAAWREYLTKLREDIDKHGKTPTLNRIETDKPKSLEGKAGGHYELRRMRQDAKAEPDLTTVPGKLSRFMKFLELSTSEEISSNELKTHGFPNLENLLNSGNYA